MAAAFFGWEVYLFAAAEEQELTAAAFAGYGVGFWLLSLAAAAACFLEVKLPLRAGRLISWAVLLLLPLGSFIAVDFINSTRILNFSFQTGLANYLCYLMVFAVIYALSRRVWVTALAGGLIFLVFGIANYFVVQFRGPAHSALGHSGLQHGADGFRRLYLRADAFDDGDGHGLSAHRDPVREVGSPPGAGKVGCAWRSGACLGVWRRFCLCCCFR